MQTFLLTLATVRFFEDKEKTDLGFVTDGASNSPVHNQPAPKVLGSTNKRKSALVFGKGVKCFCYTSHHIR